MTDLAAIKRALSIPDVAQRLGINVPRGKGDATCPRHNGQSLRLHEDYFYCWGGCADHGGKGDIFNLVMFIEGVDFATALRRCAEWAGIKLEISPAEERRIEQRRKVEDLLGFAADFYAGQYTGSPAEAYAEARKINHPDARLGYAPDAWDALTKALTATGASLPDAETAGLIRARDGGRGYFDHFRDRLILPAYEGGRCVYIQARALSDEQKPKYINVAVDEPPLYHVNGALKSPAPAVTESSTDMLRLACAGIKAVGTYGAQLKEHQRRRLLRFEKVYAAGQNDDAGLKFVDAMALALGERVRVSNPPAAYKGWDEALAAGIEWAPDDALTWVRWKVLQIPPADDFNATRQALQPVFTYLAQLEDEATATVYLEELRRRYKWPRPLYTQYLKQIKDARAAQRAAQRPDTADVDGESDVLGESVEPPTFISPALAEHQGTVYVAQMMAFKSSKTTKKAGEVTATVWRPVIISSDRRRLLPEPPPDGAPDGAVTFLDRDKNLALRGGFYEAAEGRWSYSSIVAFLNGTAPTPTPHEVYDALMASLRQYVYHAEESSYTVDVLWAMGTYFHQIFQAFPYLALHGHRGAGKSTLLTWLSAVCFNARFVVNASEAALYRSIQATAPTMLIDEQEGLNSSKAAKENKADLMGILKSGYKRGAMVARQRIDRPEITEHFEVYSPKALAAIEHFEDVLESRAILTFMTEKPGGVTLLDNERITTRDAEEFAPLRDQLYLLLMGQASDIPKIAERVIGMHENRSRELFKPLYTMAALVDISRGDGPNVWRQLEAAADAKLRLRRERDNLTPEAMLRDALRLVVARAKHPTGDDEDPPTVRDDGMVLADAMHVREAFESLFSTTKQSFFNDQWLGKQVQKTPGIEPTGQRRRRKVREWSEVEREAVWKVVRIAEYVVDPAVYVDAVATASRQRPDSVHAV
jgi:DNA primase